MCAGVKANLHSLWRQLFLFVLIIAANSRLDPGSGDINGSSNDGRADLDRRSDDRHCRIGHGNDCTA